MHFVDKIHETEMQYVGTRGGQGLCEIELGLYGHVPVRAPALVACSTSLLLYVARIRYERKVVTFDVLPTTGVGIGSDRGGLLWAYNWVWGKNRVKRERWSPMGRL
jgi:hypothetical protein